VLALLYDEFMSTVLLCWDLQMERDLVIKIPQDISMAIEAQILPNLNLGATINGKFNNQISSDSII